MYNTITAIKELTNPKFIRPFKIEYILNNTQREWEAVESHNSVAILLYHKEKDAFVVVKQLRPTVLYATKKDGYMYELCAGIIDKEKSDKEIAKEEILEECGYDVPLEKIKKITTFYTSVGISGTSQTLYYAELQESMHTTEGGGLEDESIEVIYIPKKEVKQFMFDEKYKKTPGMMMAFYWFFDTFES
jgi:UDP-sugar diphosphatase